mmetsp:Transcript_6284/g.15568  ORF Transcript_6284/g.15568 Transcript_6284/m.15568 type:complete len:133 (-) Transcript_6284:191-589(-)
MATVVTERNEPTSLEQMDDDLFLSVAFKWKRGESLTGVARDETRNWSKGRVALKNCLRNGPREERNDGITGERRRTNNCGCLFESCIDQDAPSWDVLKLYRDCIELLESTSCPQTGRMTVSCLKQMETVCYP